MIKLLIRLFIKDKDNVKDPKVRESYGKLAGVIGIVSNLFLCVSKILIGIISGSIAIIADGINNLTDASSSIITLVGFKLAAMPEDEEHPYGHARIEYLTGLIVSLLILMVGFQLLKSSLGKVLNPSPVEFSYLAVGILAASILVKIWQSMVNIKIGKLINSLTLTATGADSRNDVISTSAVLIGLLIGRFSGLQIDGYLGCLVSVFIMWSGIQLIRETAGPLLGEAPNPEMVRELVELVSSYDGVMGIHDLVVHNYGPGRIFASIHIEVDALGDLMASHDMIDNIETSLSDKLKIHLVAHMDPIKVNDPLTMKIATILAPIISDIEGVSGLHDLRTVPGPTHTNIIFDLVLESKCKLAPTEIKDTIAGALTAVDPTYCVVISFDKGYTKL